MRDTIQEKKKAAFEKFEDARKSCKASNRKFCGGVQKFSCSYSSSKKKRPVITVAWQMPKADTLPACGLKFFRVELEIPNTACPPIGLKREPEWLPEKGGFQKIEDICSYNFEFGSFSQEVRKVIGSAPIGKVTVVPVDMEGFEGRKNDCLICLKKIGYKRLRPVALDCVNGIYKRDDMKKIIAIKTHLDECSSESNSQSEEEEKSEGEEEEKSEDSSAKSSSSKSSSAKSSSAKSSSAELSAAAKSDQGSSAKSDSNSDSDAAEGRSSRQRPPESRLGRKLGRPPNDPQPRGKAGRCSSSNPANIKQCINSYETINDSADEAMMDSAMDSAIGGESGMNDSNVTDSNSNIAKSTEDSGNGGRTQVMKRGRPRKVGVLSSPASSGPASSVSTPLKKRSPPLKKRSPPQRSPRNSQKNPSNELSTSNTAKTSNTTSKASPSSPRVVARPVRGSPKREPVKRGPPTGSPKRAARRPPARSPRKQSASSSSAASGDHRGPMNLNYLMKPPNESDEGSPPPKIRRVAASSPRKEPKASRARNQAKAQPKVEARNPPKQSAPRQPAPRSKRSGSMPRQASSSSMPRQQASSSSMPRQQASSTSSTRQSIPKAQAASGLASGQASTERIERQRQRKEEEQRRAVEACLAQLDSGSEESSSSQNSGNPNGNIEEMRAQLEYCVRMGIDHPLLSQMLDPRQRSQAGIAQGAMTPLQQMIPAQQQMMPGQMMPGQMIPGQMMPSQQQQMMPGQMMPSQQQQMMPGQMMPSQQQQMMSGQMMSGQMMPGQMSQQYRRY